MKSLELRQKRAPLAKRIKELADATGSENRDFTAEETQEWTRVNAEYDALSKQIDIAERSETIERESAKGMGGGPPDGGDPDDGKGQRDRGEVSEEQRCLALQGWCRQLAGKPLRKEHRAAYKSTRFNPDRGRMSVRTATTGFASALQQEMRNRHLTAARRALSSLLGVEGGFMVPTTMMQQFELNQLLVSGVLQQAEILRTPNGQSMSWPTADDTSNEGEIVGESTDAGQQNPTFGQKTWGAHKFSSKFIRIPHELLEDSPFDLAAALGQLLGERLGRAKNRKFTLGDGGPKQPLGIVTAATIGKTTASSTAIAADEVLDLVHSVDPAYRMGAGFMMADAILLALRKLKDAEGRYLWQSGLEGGMPDRLSGYPIALNTHMSGTLAASNDVMLFGYLRAYKVREVNQVRMLRLMERFAELDEIGMIAFHRADGNLLDAGTAPVKKLRMKP